MMSIMMMAFNPWGRIWPYKTLSKPLGAYMALSKTWKVSPRYYHSNVTVVTSQWCNDTAIKGSKIRMHTQANLRIYYIVHCTQVYSVHWQSSWHSTQKLAAATVARLRICAYFESMLPSRPIECVLWLRFMSQFVCYILGQQIDLGRFGWLKINSIETWTWTWTWIWMI